MEEDEAGDLLEDSWFFGNLLNTKPRTISRCYSDLASNSCPYPNPSLSSNQDHVINNERKYSSFSSMKQPLVAPISLTRSPSMPASIETQSLLMEKPKIPLKLKSSNFSSRKQPPVAPSSLTRTPSLPNSKETQYFSIKKTNPSPNWTPTSSMSTSIDESDQEDEEDQESEFSLGRLIRQASMNHSHTTNPHRHTPKPMTENVQKKPVVDQEKISSDMRKMERNMRSKRTKSKGGSGAPLIPEGLGNKNSSEDMKAHIKFWARAVASNVRQECS
ncbi:uncharacterized protein [Rutidosis leptorrhynchoides]|uniref:uncharacterized protein n=1 Tax=Rutidosis leptorrhynchoides TaxID=125765 RepID=UPI003A9A0386